MTGSPIFRAAARQWSALRTEFELHREAAYELAETECNGSLLNARGKKAGVNAYSLFIGPATRAYAYASEELVDHWMRYPRITFAAYEAQLFEREREAS